jgi:hypothetical protein
MTTPPNTLKALNEIGRRIGLRELLAYRLPSEDRMREGA